MATVDGQAGRATAQEVAQARAVLDGTAHQGPVPLPPAPGADEVARDLLHALEAAHARLARLRERVEPGLQEPCRQAVGSAARPA